LRKVVWWLDVDEPAAFAIGAFPIFISDGPAGAIYGFPIHRDEGFKIADHAGGEPADPDRLDRAASDREAQDVLDFARANLRGITGRIVHRAVCMYTVTPDRDFVVDRDPRYANVIFGAGFSGHGFKFAPAIGEMLATLALDAGSAPPERFAAARLSGLPGTS
jgi:sarcosine oxidase